MLPAEEPAFTITQWHSDSITFWTFCLMDSYSSGTIGQTLATAPACSAIAASTAELDSGILPSGIVLPSSSSISSDPVGMISSTGLFHTQTLLFPLARSAPRSYGAK